MSKEFGGGAAPAGFAHVPFEWNEDAATPVAITHFNFDALDSLEDRARECLASGQPLTPLLEEIALNIVLCAPPKLKARLLGRIWARAYEEATARFLGLIIDARDPKFRAVAFAHLVNSSVLGNESVPETAARHGRRKQALFQEIDHMRKLTGIAIKRSNERDLEARQKMRVANFRHRVL